MIYMNCLHLVEPIDFDIKIVPIRVHVQKLGATLRGPVLSEKVMRGTRHPPRWCLMGLVGYSFFDD